MAFTTTPNLGLKKPDTANSVDTWGAELNDTIDTLDGHTHAEAGAIKITPAALNINDDIAMGGNDLDAVGVIDFQAVEADDVANVGALYLDDDDNELYWVTTGGTKVKLTNGNSINTALVGGITGDYTSTDADIEYSDSLKAYKFLQAESPDHYAKIRAADLALYEATSGITEAVTVKSPASLAAGYSLTLPDALPAAPDYLSVDASGQVGFGGVERTLLLPAAAGQAQFVDGGTDATYNDVNNGAAIGWRSVNGSARAVDYPIPLCVGDRITAIDAWVVTGDTETVSVKLFEVDPTTGIGTQKGPTKTSGTTGSETLSFTSADADIPLTLLDDKTYVLAVLLPNTSTNSEARSLGAKVTYDRPAS